MIPGIIIAIIFILYSVLVLYYAAAWRSARKYDASQQPGLVKIAVVVAARNEASNIGNLLTALSAQTYPADMIEVIVVDDHSDDNTSTIAATFPGVRVIQLQEEAINSYKKKAIETGIAASTAELVVTTDADCIPPPGWLSTLAAFKLDTNALMIVAPVVIECNSSILQLFQSMDFMVLQGITGAAVHKKHLSMCNGANLAYEKKVFTDVGGFTGIDHIASGDDMLLMHKINIRYPDSIHYLKSKEAIVSTRPVGSWKEFFQQRIRWASKTFRYDDKRIFPVLLLVYLFNLSFLVLFVAGFWNYNYWIYLLVLWIMKTIVEFPLFYNVARFFDKPWASKLFFLFQPLHIFYTIVAGFFSQFGKYEWKGRKVR